MHNKSYSNYDIGSIVVVNGKEHVVVMKNNKKTIQQLTKNNWHNDMYHIMSNNRSKYNINEELY